MRVHRLGVLGASLAIVLSASAASAEKKPPGDPPGNNGTLKVVADEPSDPDPGNEPQIDGCYLWLEYYGFDQSQTADITFTAQPPTGDKELLTHPDAAISDDPAGGGQDDDAVLGYNLRSSLEGLNPHPQQGYHIKVESNSDGAPGGPKQKVFWLNCTEPAKPGTLKVTKEVLGTPPSPPTFTFDLSCSHSPLDQPFTIEGAGEKTFDNIPAGTVCVVTETGTGGATGTEVVVPGAPSPAPGTEGTVTIPAEGNAVITFKNNFAQDARVAPATAESATPQPPVAAAAAPAGSGTQVAGVTQTREADALTLPRTGSEPWRLVGLATLLVVAGSVCGVAARRRGLPGRATGV